MAIRPSQIIDYRDFVIKTQKLLMVLLNYKTLQIRDKNILIHSHEMPRVIFVNLNQKLSYIFEFECS